MGSGQPRGDRVIQAFLAEEMAHQLVDATFPHWDSRPGLSPVRPLRPANAEQVDVDDEVVSDIGRSLLALAARPRSGGRRAALHPRGTE
jgi:hypothetical protein